MVTVILAGRPLIFPEVAAESDAVLYAWHPGTMGGPAIAALLFGESVPSGKLTITFPRAVGQIPIYYAHLNTGRPPLASEVGIPLGNPVEPAGFTSKYIDVDFTPEYPFGYGLSYTTFDYSQPRLSATVLRPGGHLKVSADITNTGKRAATEVVELYVSGPAGGDVCRPVRELRGFRRVHLVPGEKKTIPFSLTWDDLAYWTPEAHFSAGAGSYKVWIAPDSAHGAAASFMVE
jgi:beta-glucosidase